MCMSSAETPANCRHYLVEAPVGNGLESELGMYQAQVFITHRPFMRKMRLCVMKWDFINVALVLVLQSWEGSGGEKKSVNSLGSAETTKVCVFKDQLGNSPATRLCAGASRCLALPASRGCWQEPLMCLQSLAPGGLLGNVPFCPVLALP